MPRFFVVALAAIVSAAFAGVDVDIRQALSKGDLPGAQRMLLDYRGKHGVTPEMLDALGWIARAQLANNLWAPAEASAKETLHLAGLELRKHPLDSEPHLPVAVGAAIEVQAQALAKQGQREAAVAFLQKQLALYGNTSIAPRIQKNINLLGLEGHSAPELHAAEYLGPKPLTLATLRGKPVLLFFWAHWCGDCKADAEFIAKIRSQYASKGLAVIAPTQRYGYAAGGEDANPAQELKYIEEVRNRFYRSLLDVPAPVSAANFRNYGASTTPTIVVIDRAGIVRTYHPGAMTFEELRRAVEQAL
jgi:thiol-disulfide isomerase/thioredoxin